MMKEIYFPYEIPQDYIRMYTHLANLFFERSKIRRKQHGDYTVELFVEKDRETYRGKGTLTTNEGKYETTYEEKIEARWLSEQHQEKRIYSRLFLQLLEQETGMHQHWGVLTGIRPMKLYHRHYQKYGDHALVKKEMSDSYRISDEKLEMMERIHEVQLAAIPDLYDLKKEVSIYIGIPFCPTKCAYCTFPAYAIQSHRKTGRVNTFLDALHEEIRAIGHILKEEDVRITTIYFGGGTPTSIEADEMDALYEVMYDSFPHMDKVREITVEAGRPDTITVEKLEVLKKWGIDRISVNPQSYTDATLKAIGRHHTVEETIDKFWLARKHGMNNINMDLIIGLPNEGIEEFQHSLDETEKMQPESVTIHTLSFKRASDMTKNKERYQVADRTTVEEMMKMGERWTKNNNYIPYYLYRQKNILGNLENVGYSKRGEESLYNILIMEEAQTIIGIGSGASSKFVERNGKITQYLNPKEPVAYTLAHQKVAKEKGELVKELLKKLKN